MTAFVDVHCHLGNFPNPAKILEQAPNTIIVAVTELPSHYSLLEKRFGNDKRVRVALGLHPLRAATATLIDEGQLIRYLSSTEYVGEVGLDFSKAGVESKSKQLRIFDRLLAEPILRRKVVSVHSRGAEKTTIDRLAISGIRGILHWYTGPVRLIDSALDAGLYFSINPSMFRTQKGRDAIANIPKNRVLTESDGPFAKNFGRHGEPRDMPSTILSLAKHWHVPPEEAHETIFNNFAALYAATVAQNAP